VSIGNARNAGLLAVRILGAADETLRASMTTYQQNLEKLVADKESALRATLS
jgi:5-(carboxyamino)imidazole ribonucleotide mutase